MESRDWDREIERACERIRIWFLFCSDIAGEQYAGAKTAAADSAKCISKQAGLEGHFEHRLFGLGPRHVLEHSNNLLYEELGQRIFRTILAHM